MTYLADTNILLRLKQTSHPLHLSALQGVKTLKKRSEKLYIVPQNLIEFWVVATRPVKVNGLGLSFEQATLEIEDIKHIFYLYQDTRRHPLAIGHSRHRLSNRPRLGQHSPS